MSLLKYFLVFIFVYLFIFLVQVPISQKPASLGAMECGSQDYQSASSEVSLEESNRTDTIYEANRDIKTTCEEEYCLLSKAKE